jgi:hypothetical protein
MTARALFAAALLTLAGPVAATATAETPKEKAERLLADARRGKGVLQFLHLGSTYVSHKKTEEGAVRRNGREVPGHFYLDYTFKWMAGGDTGSTTLTFFFDDHGRLTSVNVDKTDAIFNQPFGLANLSIAVVGQAVLDATKDRLSDADRRLLQRLIDNADAKGLLELFLKIDLAGSR